MPERSTKRAAGATRLPAPRPPAVGERLSALDTSGFTDDQLRDALADRGLSTAGTTTELAQRLSDAITATTPGS